MRESGRLAGTILAAVLCCAAAGCTGTGQPAPIGSSTPAATQSPPAAPANVMVCVTPAVTCAGEMRAEPASIVLAADGSTFVRDLTWTGWGSATARGTGTMERDDCTPSCAQGALHAYQATISLSGLTAYGSGDHAYATMVVTAPSTADASYDYQHLVP